MPDQLGYQVNEAKGSCACRKNDVVTLRVRAKSLAHRAFDLKPGSSLVDLGRQALGFLVVLDAKSHLVRVFRIQKSRIKRLVILVTLWLQCIDVGVVDFRSHCIAGGIVAGNNVTSVKVAHKEVLRKKIQFLVVTLPVWYTLLIRTLKNDRLCRSIDVVTQILPHLALDCSGFDFRRVFRNYKIVNNHASKS